MLGKKLLVALIALTFAVFTPAGPMAQEQLLSQPGQPAGASDGPRSFAPPTLFVTAWAVIEADGTIVRQSGDTVSAQRLAELPGRYEVIFDDDVTSCAYTATQGFTGSLNTPPPGTVTVVGRFGNPNGIFIATYNNSGTFADRAFHVLVSC